MSEQLKEALSAAMDDEADAFELRRVLDESCADPELREQWHRMHMVRAVLQDELQFDGRELRQRIWAEMEGLDETDVTENLATDVGRERHGSSPWWGRLAGSAVAVSVAALIVLFADGNLSTPENDGSESLATAEIKTTLSEPVTPVLYSEATPQDRRRLDALRMRHYQQNAINRPGAVSFVRVATFKQSRSSRSTRDE